MIITFKSNASGNVIMLENNGKEILSILGKNPHDTKGVITVEQLPGAISAIKAAMKEDKTIPREQVEDENDVETSGPVFLFQRAFPILELLERSLKENVPVTWGV